ncbi:Yip1 family protein [Bacillus suaedaesalsae]|uniref:YIP1 family protein n=1 Tax=Bacillus suaedaesalsae TaxID=2810349 RepID=A0ABS2DKJ8_9BACI|nr:Yip1 family protein [Bacillus suaedaesalsae]MBM6618983.1 YIP1 family protein [Bacillus suaedaesalsae]
MEEQVQKNTNKPSLFAMIWSPTEQLEKVRLNPRIWGPLAIITLLFIAASALLAYTTDIATLLGDEIPAEELALVEGFTRISMLIGGVLGPIIGILISTAIYLVIAKIVSSDVTFKQLFSMNTFLMIVSALGMIVNTLVIWAIGGNPAIYVTSLGSIIPVDGFVGGMLGAIEVFTIWGTVLSAIGLQKVAGFSKGLAWGVSIVFLIIGLVFAGVGGAMQGLGV